MRPWKQVEQGERQWMVQLALGREESSYLRPSLATANPSATTKAEEALMVIWASRGQRAWRGTVEWLRARAEA